MTYVRQEHWLIVWLRIAAHPLDCGLICSDTLHTLHDTGHNGASMLFCVPCDKHGCTRSLLMHNKHTQQGSQVGNHAVGERMTGSHPAFLYLPKHRLHYPELLLSVLWKVKFTGSKHPKNVFNKIWKQGQWLNLLCDRLAGSTLLLYLKAQKLQMIRHNLMIETTKHGMKWHVVE